MLMFRPPPVLLANVASYLVVLVLLDRPGLVVNHPHEAAVVLVSLEQLVGIKGPALKQQCVKST